ncbi:hypothetical protein TRVL_08939 [Trypanosoma vivax]|nr:hypothetical protein TRVL_08939 [Trypanosoma vivax]
MQMGTFFGTVSAKELSSSDAAHASPREMQRGSRPQDLWRRPRQIGRTTRVLYTRAVNFAELFQMAAKRPRLSQKSRTQIVFDHRRGCAHQLAPLYRTHRRGVRP